MSSRTAGIVVIGDEILKGMTKDTNSFFISKKLFSLGVKLKKVSVIPDEVDTIATEINEFSKTYDVVITSGGIGPTHDDVTYEGVAKAFGERLEIHNEMAKYVRRFYPGGRTISDNPSLKMANLPTSASILPKCSEIFPIVRVFNVVMFPGIPQLLEESFDRMEGNDLFPNEASGYTLASSPKFHCHKLYYLADEVYLVETLNKVVALFGKNVNFGSYPVLGETYSTIIAIDSFDELLAARAKMYLKSEMAHGKEVPPSAAENSDGSTKEDDIYSSVSQEVSDRVFRLLNNPDTPLSLLEPLDKAIKTVGDCFTRYDSGNGVFISFNGGKDCTALLHLIFAFYTKYYPQGQPLKALYIQTKDPFPEVEEFVHAAALRYNIKLEIQPGPLKNALQKFMEENSELKAVFIGTRRTDPKSVSLQTFQMTDGDWPRMMRVSPLLDWSYENVWTFLRTVSVPYCSLYDEGYTSIGDKCNTFPNPALKYTTKDGQTKYHPAYMLKDESIERSGRQCNVLAKAAELTSNVAEVIGSAFGPNGSAVLFAHDSSSPNRSRMPPLISRTGLEMVEILAKRNETDSVHPLLKSLVKSCRTLDAEWGDGVKSLVLVTHELLRNCSNLENVGGPGWLKKELGKALDILGKSCDVSRTSVHPADGVSDQNKCFHSATEEFSEQDMLSGEVLNVSSSLAPIAYQKVFDLLKMFFSTRFPSHVVEVVPKLLCDWIKSVEKDGRCLEFMLRNFSSLCHVKVGFPMENSCILQGILLQGYGIGHIFVQKGFSFHEERCRYSRPNGDADKEMTPSGCDTCHGCVKINVEIITEHELCSAFQCCENQFELKTNYLYLTSCVPSDLVKFKISHMGNVSVIHSIPSDDVDFLRRLIQDQNSFHSDGCDGFYVKWVRRWPESSLKNSGILWLGVVREWSLALSVPITGMKDGLKHSCYNALTVVHQFTVHSQHRCTKSMEIVPPKHLQDPFKTLKNSRIGNENQSKENAMAHTSLVTNFPLNASLLGERLLSEDMMPVSAVNMVAAGGLAEVYLHDVFVTSWLTSPASGGKAIDREVAKAIAVSALTVPKSISAKGKLMRKPGQPLAFSFCDKSTEMIAHRIGVLQNAVAVVLSLSNVSDVILISKSVSKNLSLSPNSSDSD